MKKTGLASLLPVAVLACSSGVRAPEIEIIIDNRDPGFNAELGEWSTGRPQDTEGEPFAEDFLYAESRTAGDTTVRHRARFTPHIVHPGEYDVFLWWPTESESSTAAPVTVFHAGGQHGLTINLRQHGDDWFYLGTYVFNEGTGGHLVVEDSDRGRTYADAVRFLYAEETDG
jgi:hypothetical protein